MLTYVYTARDSATGGKIKAEVQADSEKSAAKLIHDQGYSPIAIELKGTGSGPLARYRNRIKNKEKIIFSRQLSTLINAGLPLVQSLRNIADQTQSKAFQAIISEIIGDVEGGSALSAALAKHPSVFNPLYVNLVAAGETSGTLDQALERIAFQQEKDAELLSKVRGALVYPAIVLLVMFLVMGFMLVKVLPQIEVIYADQQGVNLPLITRGLLAVSHFVTRFWWVFLLLLVLAGVFTTRWIKTIGGRRIVDKTKLRAPLIGPLFMKMYMARFARTGATLVASGVPLIRVLEVTGAAINNMHIENSLKKATEKVKGGKALSDSIENDPNFLPLVPNMLRIGEQSGSIEKMMTKTADYFEKEVDNQVKTITTIIEPALMIILGIFAFIIVAAILLPIYGLAGQGSFKI